MGLALTRRLLDKNNGELWKVVMADINESAYQSISATLPPDRHLFIRTDVSDWHDQSHMFREAFQWSGGQIDFFANNAGIDDNIPFFGWMNSNKGDNGGKPKQPDLRLIDVDLKAVFFAMQLFAHYTRKTRRENELTTSDDEEQDHSPIFHPGMVVTASMAGIYPFFALPVYTAAKHGCVGLVRAAAPKLLKNEGVTLNCIMSGTVKTDLFPSVILERWPASHLTPYETIMRAFDELIDAHGRVADDGLSNSVDGVLKNGCCVEATANRLIYREPVPFMDDVQPWVWEQSKENGIIGSHLRTVFGLS